MPKPDKTFARTFLLLFQTAFYDCIIIARSAGEGKHLSAKSTGRRPCLQKNT